MTAREPQSCPDENIVYQFVVGNATASRANEVARHANSCAQCRELIAWLRRDPANAHAATLELAGPTASAEAGALLRVMRPESKDLAGQTIAGKYRLGRRLGAGGMGVVYEAINTWTERRVAIKLLHPWFSSDPETVRRFHLEARNASRIAHPNIVDVLDLGQDHGDGALYMVQEFLTGPTLRQHIAAHGRMSMAEAAEILRPIMSALAAAHDAGVVHRDVKPENIILSTDRGGQRIPKLIDFGISKITEGDVAAMLETGRAIGTPLYMSPEQLRGNQAIDGRTDIWAMGVVLFELLVGKRPFEAGSPAEVAVRILTTAAPSAQESAPDVPDAVGAVIRRALESDRTARYARMADMIEAVAGALATNRGEVRKTRTRQKRLLGIVGASIVALVALVGLRVRFVTHTERSHPAVAPMVRTQPMPPPSVAPLTTPPAAEPSTIAAPPVAPPRKRAHVHRKAEAIVKAPEPPARAPSKSAPILDP